MEAIEIYSLFIKCQMQVSTDTRYIQKGELFIALKGENFNGNTFANQALEKGASYVIVDEGEHADERIIKVENCLVCLQSLANIHRKKMPALILGIGGSNGKTTTKELLISVLSLEKNVHSTKGNFNNHIGLPLTLLLLRPEHEIAIIEMGANKAGDIQELCEIAEPDLGLITNIGKEHLEGFGSIEGVAKAESELFDYLLKHNGHAFVNMDDVWLNSMSKRLVNKTAYGIELNPNTPIEYNPHISFKYLDSEIKSPLMGIYNYQNILACIAVAEYYGISETSIKKGIESYIPKNNRSQWLKTAKGNHILLDAYNANPSSVEVALEAFEKSGMGGQSIVIIGDMFELGSHEAVEHQKIADICQGMHFHATYLIGTAFNKTTVPKASSIKLFETKSAFRSFMLDKECKNCSVLIKGSRGMKMEDLIDLY